MKPIGIGTSSQLTPAVARLLKLGEQRRPLPVPARELVVESALAGAFLATAGAMALLLPSGQALEPLTAVALVTAYAATSRIEFDAGWGYTTPTQLLFVPMLLLLPASAAPLFVAAAILLGSLPDYVSGRVHPARALFSIGDSWHAIPPALVLVAGGASGPDLADWPLYVAALAAQFAGDFVMSTFRQWAGVGISPRIQPRLLAWIFGIDLLLAPIGLMAAYTASDEPLAFLLVMPLTALLWVFARERAARIDSALELSSAYHGTALLLSDVLESDDEYTGLHSRSVVSLALEVADLMGLDSSMRRNVEFGALLHDVGKIAIPNEIINKPGPLSPEEWVVMKTHTVEGQRMLDKVGGVLQEVGTVVRASHEHWNGGGYPDGLAGEEIPLEACIVSACDAFSAMTTDRSYRSAMTVEQAMEELRRCSGTQFHPAVVEVLERLIERSPTPVSAAAQTHLAQSRA